MFRRRTFPSSKLYDQDTFYEAFMKDMRRARTSLVIESPFITAKRVQMLLPILKKLRKRGVRIVINTRNPKEHCGKLRTQAAESIEAFQSMDILVLFTEKHHRKLAIIDSEILWEGSLNILSFSDSCEIMRRIASVEDARTMVKFIGVKKYARRKYRF